MGQQGTGETSTNPKQRDNTLMTSTTRTARTRAAEANVLDRQERQGLGRELISQLYVMLRTCRIYSPDNENYERQLDKFYHILAEAFETTDLVSLTTVEGYLFFNEERLRTSLDGYLAAKYLQESFETFQIAGFRFECGIVMSTLGALFEILSGLNPTEDGENLTQLKEKTSEVDLPFFSLVPLMRLSSSKSKARTILEKKQLARKSFSNAISAVGEIVAQSSSDKPIHVSRVKRVVHSLVDQILGDETYLLELTALKHFDDYTFVHSVDVCIYAITLGFRLGFTRPMLAELGFAAMFHDIGKKKIPVDLLNKPSKLQGPDWDLVHEHPAYGAELIGKTMNLDRHTARAILVAFEHHKNLDGSGYPYVNRTEEINLYSRIVAICDFFDALTSGRKYQKKNSRFDLAVREMLRHSGTKFDPFLLKAFVNVIGIYPTGTLLLLDSDELAIVISNDPENIFRPRVKVIANKNGLISEPRVADLSAREPDSDSYVRNVNRVVDAEKYNIDISTFVLAE